MTLEFEDVALYIHEQREVLFFLSADKRRTSVRGRGTKEKSARYTTTMMMMMMMAR